MATTISRRPAHAGTAESAAYRGVQHLSRSKSALLKGTWRIDDAQTLEAGYRRYEGTAGEIMASQIIRVDRDRIPQWDPGHVDMDSYSLRYRFNPDSELVDLRVNAAYTDTDSVMYNSLTGITRGTSTAAPSGTTRPASVATPATRMPTAIRCGRSASAWMPATPRSSTPVPVRSPSTTACPTATKTSRRAARGRSCTTIWSTTVSCATPSARNTAPWPR
jgi:hypothetical protein